MSADQQRVGVLAGIAAYLMWGFFPLYWPLLEPAGALEILSHRLVWSVLVMGVLVLALGRWHSFLALLHQPRKIALLATATVAVSTNWGVYIWAVNHDHVVETSLGYFINPLISVFLGVLVLHEHLRPAQWSAIGVGAVAVVVLTATYGHLPWIALTLAISFGSYGLIKKIAAVSAIEALTLETMLAAPIALAYLLALGAQGEGHFLSEGAGHTVLFIGCGIVTAVPLLCFGEAANRVPLSVLGLLQYLTPTIQFVLGVLWFHEEMPAGRWAGFVLVWLALTIFTADGLTRRKARPHSEPTVETF